MLGDILSMMNVFSALVQSLELVLSLYHMTDMLNMKDAAISCSLLTSVPCTRNKLQRVAHSIEYNDRCMVKHVSFMYFKDLLECIWLNLLTKQTSKLEMNL